ncbi:MAG: cytochrome c biogenesis protein ResB [Gammaproteobacteria bacterium]
MSENSTSKKKSENVWLTFLGSMNLAITFLVVLAIASVIGTVLQQNQPYTDYIIKFGPFWHEVFVTLGLYDVYGAVWFLVLLGFLLLSTSVCVYRNTPIILRDVLHFRLKTQEKSLRTMANKQEWLVDQDIEKTEQSVRGFFQVAGYRLRSKDHGDHRLFAMIKGGLNRFGYVFTHVGIVVICIGGLIDGNLPLKIKEWRGAIALETRDIMANEVPDKSRLKPADNFSFRGSITLPEGSMSNLVFLNVRDGYLVQELPFTVELKDFRVEHYPSGQPKSFESDLIIRDEQLETPLEKTIAVNYPLIYRGHTIYQASFGDGGSKLQLKLWPFFDPQLKTVTIDAEVFTKRELQIVDEVITLEAAEFKAFNVFPAEEGSGKKFNNYGPSFVFKLRDASGVGIEYLNYMLPVEQDGRMFFISGVRRSVADPYRYLHIPMDPEGKVDRFMKFHAMLSDAKRIEQIARRNASNALQSANLNTEEMRERIVTSMGHLVRLYVNGGFAAIDEDIRQRVPGDKQANVAEAYIKILRNVMQAAYIELLREEGADTSTMTALDQQFFEDAMTNLAGISKYGAPFYAQLESFEHREASGLQITRSPGKNIVYLGCVMLIIGIFMMFYILPQRLWLMLKPVDGKLQLILAGSGMRNKEDFSKHFVELSKAFELKVIEAAKRQ